MPQNDPTTIGYALSALLGAGFGTALLKFLEKMVGVWVKKSERESQEEKDFREQFFSDLKDRKKREEVLEGRIERKDDEYDSLQKSYYELYAEKTRSDIKAKNLEEENSRLYKKIQQLQEELGRRDN